jgi:hypothetical protein
MSMKTYNELLFSKGFRGWLHSGRYRWVRDVIKKEIGTDSYSVIELGCYDGKLIVLLC